LIKWYIYLFWLFIISCAPEEQGNVKKVNVFLGVDNKDIADKAQVAENLPRIDTSWYDVRELYGATHPGAALPFGMVSCNASGMSEYKKGHPSGYNGKDFIGLSHFHHSGTGTIRWYYNYVLFTPKTGELKLHNEPQGIDHEKGSPGWYSCSLNSGINVETTVSEKSAMHRFTFPEKHEKHLVIDVCHYLKALDTLRVLPEKFPESVEIELLSGNSACGRVVMDGFPIWFFIRLNVFPDSCTIYTNNKTSTHKNFLSEKHVQNTGFCFSFDGSSPDMILSKIGFSFKSAEQAKRNLYKDFPDWDFKSYRQQADEKWTVFLSKIKVEDDDPRAVSMFYSALYKALLKPAYLPSENPFGDLPNYWSDFATFWDVYSTQLPLVFTFYPEYGEKIIRFYRDAYREYTCYPPALLMKKGIPWVFSKQASALGSTLFADAYAKKLNPGNWEDILNIMVAEMNSERGELFRENVPLTPSRTHNVDYSYAAFCASSLARNLDKQALADSLLRMSANWKSMYDRDGILIDNRNLTEAEGYLKQHFNFYEGNKWNYSFKLWHDMQGLIDLQGGDSVFLDNLDWYFNLKNNNTLYQFQGMNNEVDYMTPYAYLYAGRPDRTQQIIRVALAYRFRNRRGGLPGNDDSGAMSSWYAWNCIGLCPVAGQDIYLIGSPVFDRVSFSPRGNKFQVITRNSSVNNIYVQSVMLNGENHDKPYIIFEDLEKGGELIFEMGDEPSEWGSLQRPPSYSLIKN